MLSRAPPPRGAVRERHHGAGTETRTNGAEAVTQVTETKTTNTIPNAASAIGTAGPNGQTAIPKQPATKHTITVGTNPTGVINKKVATRNGGKIEDMRDGTNNGVIGTSQIQNQKYPTGTGGNKIRLGIHSVHRIEFQNHQNRQLHKNHHSSRGLSALGKGTVQ